MNHRLSDELVMDVLQNNDGWSDIQKALAQEVAERRADEVNAILREQRRCELIEQRRQAEDVVMERGEHDAATADMMKRMTQVANDDTLPELFIEAILLPPGPTNTREYRKQSSLQRKTLIVKVPGSTNKTLVDATVVGVHVIMSWAFELQTREDRKELGL